MAAASLLNRRSAKKSLLFAVSNGMSLNNQNRLLLLFLKKPKALWFTLSNKKSSNISGLYN